jgi:hypothetical protein
MNDWMITVAVLMFVILIFVGIEKQETRHLIPEQQGGAHSSQHQTSKSTHSHSTGHEHKDSHSAGHEHHASSHNHRDHIDSHHGSVRTADNSSNGGDYYAPNSDIDSSYDPPALDPDCYERAKNSCVVHGNDSDKCFKNAYNSCVIRN